MRNIFLASIKAAMLVACLWTDGQKIDSLTCIAAHRNISCNDSFISHALLRNISKPRVKENFARGGADVRLQVPDRGGEAQVLVRRQEVQGKHELRTNMLIEELLDPKQGSQMVMNTLSLVDNIDSSLKIHFNSFQSNH